MRPILIAALLFVGNVFAETITIAPQTCTATRLCGVPYLQTDTPGEFLSLYAPITQYVPDLTQTDSTGIPVLNNWFGTNSGIGTQVLTTAPGVMPAHYLVTVDQELTSADSSQWHLFVQWDFYVTKNGRLNVQHWYLMNGSLTR